jgi:hypothetical protein
MVLVTDITDESGHSVCLMGMSTWMHDLVCHSRTSQLPVDLERSYVRALNRQYSTGTVHGRYENQVAGNLFCTRHARNIVPRYRRSW